MKVEDWLGKDNALGIEIWNKKYRNGDESFDAWLDRVSNGNDKVKQLILKKKFLFGGRILANRGVKDRKYTLSNCFSGDTEIRTRQGIVKMKDVVDKDIEVFSFGAWRPATVRCFGEQRICKLNVKKLTSNTSYSVTSNHIWYAKKSSDSAFKEYTTAELEHGMILREDYTKAYRAYKPSPFGVAHGLFYGDGDHTGVHRRMNFCGDKVELLPYFMPDTVGISGDVATVCSIPKIFWGKPSLNETASYLYGWLSGYFASDGSIDTHGNCVICSSKKSDLEFVQDVLCVLGMPIYEIREQVRESNLTHEVSTIYILTLNCKYLNESFFIRSKHKERYLSKKVGSRKDAWLVDSVETSDEFEPVYCVVEDERHSFTLKNGILTHNCYCCSPPEDSIESIFETAGKLARTFSYGGGVGIDLSKLAPRGAKVNNTAGESTGAVSFTDLYSIVTGLIGQQGRRGALMLSLACDHPDVEEFIQLKTDLDRVTKANVSVRMSDEFMQAVTDTKCSDYQLSFHRDETGETISKTVDASKIFQKLCDANYDYGEPGILFWDTIKHGCLLSEYGDFTLCGVNPCSEQPLPAGGSCLLGSMNLAEYVDEYKKFNIKEFEKDIQIAVEALNEVLKEGLMLHPLQEQRDAVKKWRQIGLGIMGLGDMLIKMGIKYGSAESLKLCDYIGKKMFRSALIASANLKKGHDDWDDALIRSEIYKRHFSDTELFYPSNSQLLTVAPTGSISTMIGVSGGIEPIFAKSFNRRTVSLSGKDETHAVRPKVIEDLMNKLGVSDDKDLPTYVVTALEIPWMERVSMQSIWQKHIDASISSTINLPENFPKHKIADIYATSWEWGCKGLTIFRQGCKRDAILTTDAKSKDIESTEVKSKDVEPSTLVGKKRKLMTGCGSLHCTAFFDSQTGELKEVFLNRGSDGGCMSYMNAMSRLASLSLRNGCNAEDVINQLKSVSTCPSYAVRKATKGDTSKGSSCPMAVANALEEMCNAVKSNRVCYESRTETVKNPCPKCGAELEFSGGCNVCKSCGWTKCD